MKKFLAIYMGTQASIQEWNELDEKTRKERAAAGLKAWMAWGEARAAAILDHGSQLGKTTRASAEGIADIKNEMTGYVLVQAESHEAAAEMFAGHPHFTLFPGASVE